MNNKHIWIFLKHKNDEYLSTFLHGKAAIGANTDTVFPMQFEEQNVFLHHIENIFAFGRSV